MVDFSDERPVRWWVLDPEGHHLRFCGHCGRELDLDKSTPMKENDPLCAICAGREVNDAPLTATYLSWLSTGDPRWWSPWMCNCQHCEAEEAIGG